MRQAVKKTIRRLKSPREKPHNATHHHMLRKRGKNPSSFPNTRHFAKLGHTLPENKESVVWTFGNSLFTLKLSKMAAQRLRKDYDLREFAAEKKITPHEECLYRNCELILSEQNAIICQRGPPPNWPESTPGNRHVICPPHNPAYAFSKIDDEGFIKYHLVSEKNFLTTYYSHCLK